MIYVCVANNRRIPCGCTAIPRCIQALAIYFAVHVSIPHKPLRIHKSRQLTAQYVCTKDTASPDLQPLICNRRIVFREERRHHRLATLHAKTIHRQKASPARPRRTGPQRWTYPCGGCLVTRDSTRDFGRGKNGRREETQASGMARDHTIT